MTGAESDPFASLQEARLLPAVEQAIGRRVVSLPHWTGGAVGGSSGAATGGVRRLSGSALLSNGEEKAWSLVVKRVCPPPATSRFAAFAREPRHWAYWRREPLAYQSGLLKRLRFGLSAPRCALVEEVGSDEVWLWLEDVPDSAGRLWPASRYVLAARHLGEFAGAFLGQEPLPDEPWLADDFFRRRIALAEQEHNLALFWDKATWRHPLIAGRFSPQLAPRLRAVWDARSALLEALDGTPQTLRHGDAHRHNLRSRTPVAAATGSGGGGGYEAPAHQATPEDETVALDWAGLSIGPVGADLTDLAIGVLVGPTGYGSGAFVETLYAAYLDGLRASGWTGEATAARLGFAVCMSLAGVTRLHWTMSMALDASRHHAITGDGRTVEAVLDSWSAATDVFLSFGEEALALAPQVVSG